MLNTYILVNLLLDFNSSLIPFQKLGQYRLKTNHFFHNGDCFCIIDDSDGDLHRDPAEVGEKES